jgi:hypothetical protein
MIFEADRVAPRESKVVRDQGINLFEGIDPLSRRGLGWHQVTLGRGERCCLWTLIITRICVASE